MSQTVAGFGDLLKSPGRLVIETKERREQVTLDVSFVASHLGSTLAVLVRDAATNDTKPLRDIKMADTPLWLECIQAASYAGSALAAIIAAVRYVSDRNAARRSDENAARAKAEETQTRAKANAVAEMELDWRRVQAAQALMQSMEDDPLSSDAMRMLDWNGRAYPSGSSEKKWNISREDARTALRVRGKGFSDVEMYIRDAFDRFFMYWEKAQHGVDTGLIKITHIEFPLLYWASKINEHRDVFHRYLQTYGFTGTVNLLGTLEKIGLPRPKPKHEYNE